MTLRAVVVGAGWAGEGHTNALRHCGVDVVAICGRQADVVQAVAERLHVPHPSTDWQQTLAHLRPDIVAVATPASLRSEVIESAAALGAHIFCDKPLAITAAEAKQLLHWADQAGIKHAYAATHKYDPSIAWVAELLRNQEIGQLQAIDCCFRFSPSPALEPWTWMDSLSLGGGALNNGLTHFLAMLETMTGSSLLRITGEARYLSRKKPVVPALHDVRHARTHTVTAEQAAHLEWRESDADWAFSALMHFASPAAGQPEISVCAIIDFNSHNSPANGWYFYGSQGVITGKGVLSLTLSRQDDPESAATPLPTPQRLLDQLPQIGDDVQNKWVALARDFVADIRGEAHQPYLTFHDGWRYQTAIEAIRAASGWYDLPT
jgi:predicted dehydrogenase